MFTNTQMGGLNLGFPDVCITPIGPIPTPIPYPNFSTGIMAIPPTASLKCLTVGMPTHNITTMIPMSLGDCTGVLLGVLSGLIIGPTRTLIPSFTTLTGGLPTNRMLSMTGQNGFALNAPGLTLIPSQFKCLILSP